MHELLRKLPHDEETVQAAAEIVYRKQQQALSVGSRHPPNMREIQTHAHLQKQI